MKLTMGELRRIIHEEAQVVDEQGYRGGLWLRGDDTINEEVEDVDEGVMDWVQGALDVAGLIPGVGEAADGVNALISVARGNPLEAAISLVSMIPVAGDAVGKGGKAALKVLEPAIDIIKKAGPIADVVKKIGPGAAKNLGKAIGPIKDVVLNNRDKIQKAIDVVGDISKAAKPEDVMKHFDTLEKAVGVKIPDIAKSKASEIAQEKLKKVDMGGIKSILDFIGTFNAEEATALAEAIERNIVIDELHRATSGAYIGEGDGSLVDPPAKITLPTRSSSASYRSGRGRRDYIMTKEPYKYNADLKKDKGGEWNGDDEDDFLAALDNFTMVRPHFAGINPDDYHVYFYDSLKHGS